MEQPNGLLNNCEKREIELLEAGKETESFDHMSKPLVTHLSTSSLLTNESQNKKRDFHNRSAKAMPNQSHALFALAATVLTNAR